MQYFKHMSNMRNDTKIKRVINKYGLKGYGLYNLILESITEQLCNDNPNPVLEETCFDIASFYNEDTTEIKEMVSFMINQGLFELDENTERMKCSKIYKYLEASQTRSEKIRELIKKYKEFSKHLKIEVSQMSQTKMTKSEEKNRIEKNRKEKKKNRKEKEIKNIYAKFVKLTEKEYNTLIDKFNEFQTIKMIEKLNLYKASKGTTYKSDYMAIYSWVVNWYEENRVKIEKDKPRESDDEFNARLKKIADEKRAKGEL